MFVDDWGIFSNGAGGRVLVTAICPRFIGLPLARGAPAAASKAMTEDCFILTVLSLVYNLVTRADSRGDLDSILPVLEQNGEKQVISTCKGTRHSFPIDSAYAHKHTEEPPKNVKLK